MSEAGATFPCFGSSCSVFVTGDGALGSADAAVAHARAQLEIWHRDFTRFEPDSELSRMNEDRSHAVVVSPAMARFAALVRSAAEVTNGLVDATLLGAIEAAGYTGDIGAPVDLQEALASAPQRKAASPSLVSRWRLLRADTRDNVVFRPPGLRLDSGGLAKGLFCDLLAEQLGTHEAFAIDAAGDVRTGGRGGLERAIQVASPFGGEIIHTVTAQSLAAATSGIGRRSWIDADGRPCHHLLDPSTGKPAFTGIVQVTAFATRAARAEVRAKAALLSGPNQAHDWLPDGGVIVFDDGSQELLTPVVGRSQESPSFL